MNKQTLQNQLNKFNKVRYSRMKDLVNELSKHQDNLSQLEFALTVNSDTYPIEVYLDCNALCYVDTDPAQEVTSELLENSFVYLEKMNLWLENSDVVNQSARKLLKEALQK